MKFAQVSVILCVLSASARMISRVPARTRTYIPSVRRRALSTPPEPSNPDVHRGNFSKLRLILFAATLFTAYEGYECFKIFADHYEPDEVVKSQDLIQLMQFDEEQGKLMDLIYHCDDVPNDECLKIISESDVSYQNKQLLVDLLGSRGRCTTYKDSLVGLFGEKQWSNYKSLRSLDRKYALANMNQDSKRFLYSFAVQKLVKDLEQFDEPARATFLAVHSTRSYKWVFKTDLPFNTGFKLTLRFSDEVFNGPIELQDSVTRMDELFESFFSDTEGLFASPINVEGILSLANSNSQIKL